MATLTLEGSVLNVTALHTVMLGVCMSTCIVDMRLIKESIPAACLIQQEGTLMSMLGYIVNTILVRLSLCTSTLAV